jgi:hypothetical protein
MKLFLPRRNRDVSEEVNPNCQRLPSEDDSQNPGECCVIYRPRPLGLKVFFADGDQHNARISRQALASHPCEAVIGFQFQSFQAAGLPKKQEET